MSYYNIGITGTTPTLYLPAFAPTGTIAPFIGSQTDAPEGWVIGNGVTRTNTNGIYDKLASIGIGSINTITNTYTPPNYNAAFLRGTGTASSNTAYVGPNVNNSQFLLMQNHAHDFGSHSHTTITSGTNYYAVRQSTGGDDTPSSFDRSFLEYNIKDRLLILNTAVTSATEIDGGVATVTNVTTGDETNPYNYGVNWIIKL